MVPSTKSRDDARSRWRISDQTGLTQAQVTATLQSVCDDLAQQSGLSVTFTDTKRLGKHLTGLAQASVFPGGNATKFAVVRAYKASLDAANLSAPLSLGLESWINAQVMAEGIRRAGRDITRDKLRAGLASIRGFEVGEVVINFNTPGPYVGTSSVKLGIFGPDGILRA